MYALIWRALPGPTWLRVILCATLIAGAVVALFAWGYPWLSDNFLESDPSLG